MGAWEPVEEPQQSFVREQLNICPGVERVIYVPLVKKKKNLQSEGGKKRCFLTKTAMEFGRAACSLYNQIPFCASIILQCPWLLSQQVLEGRFYLRTGSFAMRDPGAPPW